MGGGPVNCPGGYTVVSVHTRHSGSRTEEVLWFQARGRWSEPGGAARLVLRIPRSEWCVVGGCRRKCATPAKSPTPTCARSSSSTRPPPRPERSTSSPWSFWTARRSPTGSAGGRSGKRRLAPSRGRLSDGLAEAHRKQVIHGDLKSNNVIVTITEDGSLRAVITDFGMARASSRSVHDRALGISGRNDCLHGARAMEGREGLDGLGCLCDGRDPA